MFSFFRPKPETRAARALYAEIVRQARQPAFYRDWAIADTLDGRFDMIALHAILVMRRLNKAGGQGPAVSQALFDHMFLDMDESLREMGVGDLTVPKKVKEMGEAFFGRAATYRAALEGADQTALEGALARNLYRLSPDAPRPAALQPLTGYVLKVVQALDEQLASDLFTGGVAFPAPRTPQAAL